MADSGDSAQNTTGVQSVAPPVQPTQELDDSAHASDAAPPPPDQAGTGIGGLADSTVLVMDNSSTQSPFKPDALGSQAWHARLPEVLKDAKRYAHKHEDAMLYFNAYASVAAWARMGTTITITVLAGWGLSTKAADGYAMRVTTLLLTAFLSLVTFYGVLVKPDTRAFLHQAAVDRYRHLIDTAPLVNDEKEFQTWYASYIKINSTTPAVYKYMEPWTISARATDCLNYSLGCCCGLPGSNGENAENRPSDAPPSNSAVDPSAGTATGTVSDPVGTAPTPAAMSAPQPLSSSR